MKKRKIYKVNAIFNKDIFQSKYENLFFNENGILYKGIVIKIEEIKSIDISMCSSQAGTNGTYYFRRLMYHVDIIVNTLDNQVMNFQIMNDSSVENIFIWIKENKISYNDQLKLEEIYNIYKDDVKRYNYIALNFRKWAKKYHLDNPRENYLDSIIDGFEDSLKDASPLINAKLLEKADFKKLKKLRKKGK